MARGSIRIALGTCAIVALAGWTAIAATDPSAGLSASADRVTLNPDQLRDAATGALRAGKPDVAYRFSSALVKRDAGDHTAWLIRARAARDMGQYDTAKQSARTAWKQAKTPEQKFASSMIMAQALSSAGQRTWSQLWLRRAIQHAPNDAMEKRAIRDFRYVRTRNPWKTQLSFSITPDSNINNGTSEKGTGDFQYDPTKGTFEEITFGANSRPIPGLEIALGVDTRYRFRETQTHANDLTFRAQVQHYSISSSTKAKVTNVAVEGNDYDFAYYEFGYAHKGKNRGGTGEYRVNTALGQTWYGGEEYSRYINVGGGQTFHLQNGHNVSVNLSARRTFGVKRSDLDELNASLSYQMPLGSAGILSTSLDASVGNSPNSPRDDYDAVGVRARYILAKPVFGARTSLSLSARNKSLDQYRYGLLGQHVGRKDTQFAADFTMVFTEIDYYGFSPSMSVSASRTNSNVARLQSDRFGINFGIQSSF